MNFQLHKIVNKDLVVGLDVIVSKFKIILGTSVCEPQNTWMLVSGNVVLFCIPIITLHSSTEYR